MNQRHTTPAGRSALGGPLGAILALLLTAALSALIVAMIIFAPFAFIDTGRNAATRGLAAYARSIGGYFAGLAQGQLGDARRSAAAWRSLIEAARRTAELLGISMALAIPLGAGWGALLATARRPIARALLFGLNTIVMALPSFAVMLLAIEAFATLTLRTGYQITLVHGYGLDRHLILPCGVLALRGSAYLARALEIAQADVLAQDWIRAARARGLGGLALWWRHVLPALRLPLLGILLGMLRVMVGGIIIVDYIYGWGGLGQRMLNFRPFELASADIPLAISAALVLVVLFVAVDTLGQLALRYADPRLRDLKG